MTANDNDPRRPRVAIVGSGVAGLTAALGLQDDCDVVVFEAAPRRGGHILPHAVAGEAGQPRSVDTGFVVFIPQTYPKFTALLDWLGVEHGPAITPFRITDTVRDVAFEAAQLVGLCGKVLPAACRRDLLDLYRVLARLRKDGPGFIDNVPLSSWVADRGYQIETIELGVLPWVASFWGMSPDTVLTVSARVALREIARNSGPHGMHRVRPSTRAYLDALLEAAVRVEHRAERVVGLGLGGRDRDESPMVRTEAGEYPFDRIVLATDAAEAAALLERPDPAAHRVLAALPYVPTVAIVHHDPRWLPTTRQHWRTFHHRRARHGREISSTTTWVFDLLHEWTADPAAIERPTLLTTGEQRFEPERELDPERVAQVYRHRHLVATPAVVDALPKLDQLDRGRPFTLAGSYLGLGALHEDAVVSGARAADKIRNEFGICGYHWPWTKAE